MKRAWMIGGALALGVAAATRPAFAQASAGVDIALNSRYNWRGLTFTSKPVLQPALFFDIPLYSPLSFTVGGWTNIELGQYDGATDISMGGGQHAFDLTEFDYWGDLNLDLDLVRLSGGVNGYVYPDGTPVSPIPNTVELNGRVSVAVPLHPKLALWYDIYRVKGLYIEASASQAFHPAPTVSLVFGALAGFSSGQEQNAQQPAEAFWFKNRDFTHADLWVSVPVRLGALSLTPSGHFLINHDPFTKWTQRDAASSSGFNSADTKFWVGVMLSWSRGFGGAPR